MTKNTSSCVLQPSESQVCGGPTTICFFFFFLSLHLQPPTRCPQSASIYSSMALIREKRQQKRQFSKEGKRDRGCVVRSAWKFTCHWFPLCPSPPHAAVCCLKDWKRKHRPAGPSSNTSASSGEGPEAERHLNRDAVLFRTPAGGSAIQQTIESEWCLVSRRASTQKHAGFKTVISLRAVGLILRSK